MFQPVFDRQEVKVQESVLVREFRVLADKTCSSPLDIFYFQNQRRRLLFRSCWTSTNYERSTEAV